MRIIQPIVSLHGGTVAVASTENQSSTFTVGMQALATYPPLGRRCARQREIPR